MENKTENIPSNRTEFSDFVVSSSRHYFDELDMPQGQRERLTNKMLVIPFGSVTRGNASEIKSDLDLIFIERDSSQYDQPVLPFTDGDYNKEGTNLGKHILNEYEKTHPTIREQRSKHVGREYIGEIEVDDPHILVDDLIDAIASNTLKETPRGGGGHSSAVVLGLILNVDPQLAIVGDPIVFEQVRTRIKASLKGKTEAEKEINEAYDQFVEWRKTEDDY